ncbi:bax inhibitor [Thecamonas trahens ATCC 50062]|uniref:Bax inhibitor n=1 Tax=Thecamonas trahens ATCC 50062 TaxID=461836 RepID=A0A0L0DI57_THETB|nr:bax inhibitor [Thecamonas trahens ATCC 50062]KNC50988.1 bax inhibitor [Thecamonas trahens ATCC 50062]|eukprot:XP_013756458.1 bax inhibitor [Thecamonas trahens ATCC 50062]
MATGGMRFGMANGEMNWDAVKAMDAVTPAVQAHLVDVYSLLTFGVAMAAFGTFTHLAFNIGGVLTTLGALAALMYIGATDKNDQSSRKAGFVAFTFCKGASIGPLVGLVLLQDASLVLMALVGTVAVFAAFTAMAMYAPRRQVLLFGGMLSSAITGLLVLSIANLFIGSSALFTAQLWVGLCVFSGFVAFDTQLMIEKAARGDRDAVWHAVELFIDFVAIFVRILIILSRNKKKESRRERR